MLEKTHFSMAQQDVRYYLNGMLLEIDGAMLRAVATDGHRLALCEAALESKAKTSQQVIVPRKGVLELQRVLTDEGTAAVAIGTNHVRAQIGDVRFTSKLIDGRFPEYSRVIPAAPGAAIRADRDILRQALQRTAILSNEKYRGIRINVRKTPSQFRPIIRNRKRPRKRLRSLMRATSSKLGSTSITCSTPSRPLKARKSSWVSPTATAVA